VDHFKCLYINELVEGTVKKCKLLSQNVYWVELEVFVIESLSFAVH